LIVSVLRAVITIMMNDPKDSDVEEIVPYADQFRWEVIDEYLKKTGTVS
jgi:hypothetical protein